jgi:hypothetical protein
VGESAEGQADPRLEGLMRALLAPVPTPVGTPSREIVRRAIEFEQPPRVPYSFIQPLESDFFESAVLTAFGGPRPRLPKPRDAKLGCFYRDEWGVGWEVTTRHWDHAIEHPLADLAKLADYAFPGIADTERFDWLGPYLERARAAGKYVVGFDPINLFEQLRSLMGFEELMLAPYTQADAFGELLDRLTDLTIDVIRHFARLGPADGFMTWQDFGLQTSLQIKPDSFREVYMPRYARIADAAHAHGMHFIWHNCGQILDMLPHMIELGTDVVQLDQPRLMGHRVLAERFGGEVCFWNTVDIHCSAREHVTPEAIHAEVARMMSSFDRFGGGLIARHYPQPHDIELPPEFHRASYEAFLAHGCAL